MPHSYLDPEISEKLPSPKEMQAMDAASIKAGTPALELMQRAGHAIFDALIQLLDKEPEHLDSILILCGPGNNGGDGLVVAQKLKEKAHRSRVILAQSEKYSDDCRIQIQKALWAGVEVYSYPEKAKSLEGLELKTISPAELELMLKDSRIFIDALLGTGQSKAPRAVVAELIKQVNLCSNSSEPPFVLSVDIPSGVNCESGEVFEPCLKADVTVCIELVKRGLMQSPAREHSGRIFVAPIGIETSGFSEFSMLRHENLVLPPERALNFHKGDAGRVFVVGGSRNLPGAPFLSALAALRSAAGLVTLASLRGLAHFDAPEIMLEDLGEGDFFSSQHIEKIEAWLEKADSFIIGPGLGTNPESSKFLEKLLTLTLEKKLPCVIDADALNLISAFKKAPNLTYAVITPHPGEAARLLRASVQDIEKDRFESAKRLYELYGAVSVLKGASSVIYNGEVGWVNTSGNPYMATAGSGDVLSGVIAALLAQLRASETALLDAAKSGVYLHGLAGDLAHQSSSGPIIARDIIEFLPQALAR